MNRECIDVENKKISQANSALKLCFPLQGIQRATGRLGSQR